MLMQSSATDTEFGALMRVQEDVPPNILMLSGALRSGLK